MQELLAAIQAFFPIAAHIVSFVAVYITLFGNVEGKRMSASWLLICILWFVQMIYWKL